MTADLAVSRPNATPEWWQHFAEVYTAADTISSTPSRLIAAQSGVPVAAIYRWTRDARSKGLLPKHVTSPRNRKHYWSTACMHQLHKRCRQVCKFCDRTCGCPCHSPSQEEQ